MRIFKPVFVIFLLSAVAGCGPNVVKVENLQAFPKPVMTPLPARVAVYYPESFRTYTYREERDIAIGGEWIITLGETQHQVFNVVLDAMFEETVEFDSEPTTADGFNAIIVPSVADFQFALPSDNRVNVFEIWVKYNISIRDATGEELGNWPVTAYGRTPTAMLKSSETAIHAAALIAMRDAGASMISGVYRDPRLREWLGVPQRSATRPATTPAQGAGQ